MALVNREKNYIFFHIYKTAGNTIRQFLDGEELLGVHCHAKDMKKHFYSQGEQEFWDNAYKFAFIRNPYDWQVSLYYYIRRSSGHGDHEFVMSHPFATYLEYQRDVKLPEAKERPHGSNKYDTLLGFLTDDDGNMLVDDIYRCEDYVKEMGILCGKLGIPFTDSPSQNVSGNRDRDYRKYYDERSKALVEEMFGEDIEHFNYKF